MTKTKNGAAKDVATFANLSTLTHKYPQTMALLNQSVADLYTAHVALHQVHWYMRGAGFMVWHPKMDEYMESLDGYLDEISERLITLGGAPYSTMAEFSAHSKIVEKSGRYSKDVKESLERVLEIYRYLAKLFTKGFEISDEEGDSVTNDIYNVAKADIEKTIWMLAAEVGQAPGI